MSVLQKYKEIQQYAQTTAGKPVCVDADYNSTSDIFFRESSIAETRLELVQL